MRNCTFCLALQLALLVMAVQVQGYSVTIYPGDSCQVMPLYKATFVYYRCYPVWEWNVSATCADIASCSGGGSLDYTELYDKCQQDASLDGFSAIFFENLLLLLFQSPDCSGTPLTTEQIGTACSFRELASCPVRVTISASASSLTAASVIWLNALISLMA